MRKLILLLALPILMGTTYNVGVREALTNIKDVNALFLYPGDIVLFNKTETFNDTDLIVSTSNITFSSYGLGAKPIFDGVVINLNGKNNIAIDGLYFVHSPQAKRAVGGVASQNISINNCDFYDSARGGISGASGSHNWVIQNNVFHNISASDDADSIYMNANCDNWTIHDNIINDSGGDGITCEDSDNLIIYNNTIFDCRSISQGISINGGNNNQIYGNTIYGQDQNGIVIKGNNTDIYSNIIYSNGCNGILFNRDGITGNRVFDNIIYNQSVSNYYGIDLWQGGNDTKIYNNTIVDNSGGFRLNRQQNVDIKNNRIYSSR